MRNFLNFVRNTLMFIGFFIATGVYVSIAAGMAVVINDIQLDTYVTLRTGFAAVLWMILTIWIPIVILRARKDRQKQIILDSDDGRGDCSHDESPGSNLVFGIIITFPGGRIMGSSTYQNVITGKQALV